MEDGSVTIEPWMIEEFVDLFDGRNDVLFMDNGDRVWQQKFDGNIEPTWFEQKIGDSLLYGGPSVGVYPLRDGKECKWICTDLDQGDTEHQAHQIVKAWEYYGIKAWVETSKSKGHHVWVFLEDWTAGTIARRAALYIHQMGDVPADEVNPKQEITDGYGNCVRLPYWVGRDEGRMEMAGYPDLANWLTAATSSRADPDTLFLLANRYTPPEERTVRAAVTAPNGDWDGHRHEGYYPIREVYRGNESVPEGNRDNTFFVLAQYMRGIGVPIHEARATVQEVWATQTVNNQTYPLKQALEKVDRAYTS